MAHPDCSDQGSELASILKNNIVVLSIKHVLVMRLSPSQIIFLLTRDLGRKGGKLRLRLAAEVQHGP